MEQLYISVEIDPQYNRTKKPNKKGEYTVNIMLRKGRKKESIIPDIPKIPFELFKKGKANWIDKSHRQAKPINLKISKVVNLLEDYILNHDSRTLTPKEVKDWYLKNHTKGGEYKDFRSEKVSEYYDKMNKKKRSISTLVQYRSALVKLEEFKPEVRFLDFDRKFVENLAYFMGSHEKIKGTSGSTYFDKIKAVYIQWYGENYPDDPAGYDRLFKKVTVKKGKPKKNRGFTESELKAFISLDLSSDSRLDLVRDLTVFMCYSSRYSKELIPLTFDDVKIDSENSQKIQIIGTRSKTGVDFENIIFSGIQMEIFDKYHPVKEGKLFPQIKDFGLTYSKFTYSLKKLTKMIGMGDDFTPGEKLARSTFQSLISRKYDRLTKKTMLGHSNTQTQERYNSGYIDLFELTKGLDFES